jgi:hypothetical protein
MISPRILISRVEKAAPRGNLIPKKIQVQAGGKPIERTYWVKPGEDVPKPRQQTQPEQPGVRPAQPQQPLKPAVPRETAAPPAGVSQV